MIIQRKRYSKSDLCKRDEYAIKQFFSRPLPFIARSQWVIDVRKRYSFIRTKVHNYEHIYVSTFIETLGYRDIQKRNDNNRIR